MFSITVSPVDKHRRLFSLTDESVAPLCSIGFVFTRVDEISTIVVPVITCSMKCPQLCNAFLPVKVCHDERFWLRIACFVFLNGLD